MSARLRSCGWLGVSVLLLCAIACKEKAAPQPELRTMDKVAPSPVGSTQTILHKTFALKSSANFPFEVPAHAARPHLHGIFESFVGQVHGASDESANIDFVIVNAEQFAEMSQNRPSEALMSVEASHNQAVNFDLPPSLEEPAKYFLVFRNSAKTAKVIEADFRIDY